MASAAYTLEINIDYRGIPDKDIIWTTKYVDTYLKDQFYVAPCSVYNIRIIIDVLIKLYSENIICIYEFFSFKLKIKRASSEDIHL